jgi:hypothetical protein
MFRISGSLPLESILVPVYKRDLIERRTKSPNGVSFSLPDHATTPEDIAKAKKMFIARLPYNSRPFVWAANQSRGTSLSAS